VAAAVAVELVEVEEVVTRVEEVFLVDEVVVCLVDVVVCLVEEVVVCLLEEVVVTRRVEDDVVVGRSVINSKSQGVLRLSSAIGFAATIAIKRAKKIQIRSIVVKKGR
jgi:hypothetical protein